MSAQPARSPAPATTVVGIGADGWESLSPQARSAVADADVLLGGRRHLDLVGEVRGRKVPWPSPLLDGLDELLAAQQGRVCVLASGDPLLAGIGGTLVRRYGADRVRVIPAVSSETLARARLGWTAEETELISAVGRDLNRIRGALAPGRRLLVLGADETTPQAVAELLVSAGYSASDLTVLENLGTTDERRFGAPARELDATGVARLHVLAVECVADDPSVCLATVPGLPDTAFEHDGQLTKRMVRASTLSALAPMPGQLLWDVGAGSGSVAIEWCRAHPANRAVAVERDEQRCGRIERNAARLGAVRTRVLHGAAPDALAGLDTPDAVFVGGGLTSPDVLATCWAALRAGGTLAANGVTIDAERCLAEAHAAYGGELARVHVEHAEPLGGFTGWSPARAVTQWHARKPANDTEESQP